MNNTIKCPGCGQIIEITEAYKKEVEEGIRQSLDTKHQKELDEQKKNIEKQAEEKARLSMAVMMKTQADENKELKEANQKLVQQLVELNKSVRDLSRKDEQRELEYQKRFNEENQRSKEQINKELEDKYRLIMAEMTKKQQDTEKALAEAQQKAKQGSQQLQGEVFELDLEETLKKSYSQDRIEAISKGVSGADIRQTVLSPKGFRCGTILWELKRTKHWKNDWIIKLKSDVRMEKANIPVIVSDSLPEEARTGIGEKEGVWICSQKYINVLARLLRERLLEIAYQKAIAVNRSEKSEMIYAFITSHEFRQQVEAILEVYKSGKEQIEIERRAFTKQWKQRESQLERLLLSTATIYGSMQGVAGAAMPQLKDLELLNAGKK